MRRSSVFERPDVARLDPSAAHPAAVTAEAIRNAAELRIAPEDPQQQLDVQIPLVSHQGRRQHAVSR